MANKATSSSSSSQPEVTDETQDWILGAGSGWVEARTSCEHLNSLSPDLVQLPTPDTPCSRCENPVENWLCLCCKEVLCSRFVNRHMLMHHQQTGHCLALSYSDLSVWCFCCEAYLDDQFTRLLIFLNSARLLHYPNFDHIKSSFVPSSCMSCLSFWMC